MTTPLIVRDFSFLRDFRHILWGPTLKYNLLRSACAGVVLGLAMITFPQDGGRALGLVTPLMWPIGYLVFFLPFGIMLSLFRALPFVGLFAAFLSLIAVAIGDPIVYVLKKNFPQIVPVDSPPLFSLNLIFWVLDAPEVAIAA